MLVAIAFIAPLAVIVGSETRAAVGSDFGVEVLVKSGASASPRRPEIVTGRSFAPVHRGEEYVVRLHNRSRIESAVLLTVDGLSIFAFSTEGNFDSQIIVPPRAFVDVTGWFLYPKRFPVEATWWPEGTASLGLFFSAQTRGALNRASGHCSRRAPAERPRRRGG